MSEAISSQTCRPACYLGVIRPQFPRLSSKQHDKPKETQQMTITPAALAHIAAPADVQHIADWIDETGDGQIWGR